MILGQEAPAATTPTLLYEVPRGTSHAWVSAFWVCNRGGTATSFRAWIGPAGGGNEQYIYYDVPIDANDTFMMTCEGEEKSSIRLRNGDQLNIYAGNNNLSFTVVGEQI